MMRNSNPSLTASGPRHRCNQCNYFPLELLAKFRAEDIDGSAVYDTYEPSTTTRIFAPEIGFWAMVLSWIGNRLYSQGGKVRARAKVRKAQKEILPRSPDALICPRCYEILEVM